MLNRQNSLGGLSGAARPGVGVGRHGHRPPPPLSRVPVGHKSGALCHRGNSRALVPDRAVTDNNQGELWSRISAAVGPRRGEAANRRRAR